MLDKIVFYVRHRGFKEILFIILRIITENLAYLFEPYLSDSNFQRILMGPRIRYIPDLKTANTFNEKLLRMKLNTQGAGLHYLVDKLHAKWIINKYLGKDYEISTYAYGNHINSINWESLPSNFVIKPTHLSGELIICKNGLYKYNNTITKNPNLIKGICESWLEQSHYNNSREPWYDQLKPRLIIEQLLDSPDCNLLDYKFHVFNSRVEFIGVIDRTTPVPNKTVYDRTWKKQEFELNYPSIKSHMKPEKLDEMIKIAEKASKLVTLNYIRIDLYNLSEQIYVGEFTLCPSGGGELFIPKLWDYKWGRLMEPINK